MAKTDVYSWRLAHAHKTALEDAARADGTTVAQLLEQVTGDWIRARRRRAGADNVEQARLHAGAGRFVGALQGGNPHRSRQSRARLRMKLARRRAR